ncbi:MAG: glycosyltransferase WbuB [Deltaproteobacteria bacterium HGW-Deltaproteobacteria-12]|jgi:glycosyltransferase involved in cell wall biosynthesis|nr:MAG: glycosyltransferase WbuB [Deltaproteobacteria bacterium HGW-Deltaproteobacteria-12]
MRILLLVVYYLPSAMASAKLIHDLAEELLSLGHEPIVVAPDENIYSDTEISDEDGIKVLRIRTGKIKTASRLMRGINEARLSQTIWEKSRDFFRDNPCDLIIYYSPTIFFGTLVKKLKIIFSCPAYLILRDIFPQWAVDAGVLRRGLIFNYFKFKERQNYEAADIIGVQSPANLHYFNDKGINEKHQLEVIYNWSKLKEENVPYGNYRERLGLKGKVVFFYGGNIGVAQDMDNIVRLAKNMQSESTAHFLLVGSGSEVSRLRSDISAAGLTNIAIHDAVGQQEYLSMLSEFDVGLISLKRSLQTQNFPGKLLGYLYHFLPVLASINPGNDLKDILEDHQAGMVCINGEDEQLAVCAKTMLMDAELRRQMGFNAHKLLESTFSVSRAAQQILSHFNRHE